MALKLWCLLECPIVESQLHMAGLLLLFEHVAVNYNLLLLLEYAMVFLVIAVSIAVLLLFLY